MLLVSTVSSLECPCSLRSGKLDGFDGVFLSVDHEYYEQVSAKLMDIFRRFADAFEQVVIDEAYLDVTQRVSGSFEYAKVLAEQMKAEVKREVAVTFSIGIGPNKLVAKIACDEQKPDGLTIVLPAEARRFLSPLPVDRLLGVGRKDYCENG